MAESYYNEQVGEILKHYNAAEVATAGIFAAKFLERKTFTDLGIWSSSTENYYYRRLHNMVANKMLFYYIYQFNMINKSRIRGNIFSCSTFSIRKIVWYEKIIDCSFFHHFQSFNPTFYRLINNKKNSHR